METHSILQIVSGFKPNVDGMGDFARLLGERLSLEGSLNSHFLVYRAPQAPFDLKEIFPNTISYPAQPTPADFLAEAERLRRDTDFDCALIHYGPYAYSRTGEPAEFVQVVETLSQEMRVLVFFHEIYSSGWPWQRAFWTHRQQRRCVERMLRLASVAFTSNPKYMDRLQRLNTAGRPLIKIPIFSNIGEPNGLRPLAQRSRQLVVFGQLATRVRLYRDRRSALENLCRKLRIETVADVGSGQSPHIPAALAGAPVRSAGWMEDRQLSALMANSVAGVVGYWPDVWEKSGVMASYQAHALLPILVELEPWHIARPHYLPYLEAGQVSALAGEDGRIPDATLQQIADAAHAHYTCYQSSIRCAGTIASAALDTEASSQDR